MTRRVRRQEKEVVGMEGVGGEGRSRSRDGGRFIFDFNGDVLRGRYSVPYT